MKKLSLYLFFLHISVISSGQNFQKLLDFSNKENIELGNKGKAVLPFSKNITFKEAYWVSDENLASYLNNSSETVKNKFGLIKDNFSEAINSLLSDLKEKKSAKIRSGLFNDNGVFVGLTDDNKVFIVIGNFKEGVPLNKINISILSKNDISFFDWEYPNINTSVFNINFHPNHTEDSETTECYGERKFLFQQNDQVVTSYLLKKGDKEDNNNLEGFWGSISNEGSDNILTIHNNINFNPIFKIIKSGSGKKYNRIQYNSGGFFFTNLKMNSDVNMNNKANSIVGYYEVEGILTAYYKSILYNLKYHVPVFSSFNLEFNGSGSYAMGFLIDKDSNFMARDRKTIVSKFSLQNNKFNESFDNSLSVEYKNWFNENFICLSGNCENGSGKAKSKKSEVLFEGQFKSYKIINGNISFQSDNGTTNMTGNFDETTYGLNKNAIIPKIKNGTITIIKDGQKLISKGTFDDDYKLSGEGENFEFKNNIEQIYLASIPNKSKWKDGKLNGFGVVRTNSKTLKAVLINSNIDYTAIDPEGYVICKNCGKRGKANVGSEFTFHDNLACYTCSSNCYNIAFASYNLQIKKVKESNEKYQNELVQCSWCANKVARKNLITLPWNTVKCLNASVSNASGAFCSNKCVSEYSCKTCKEFNFECNN